MKTVEERGLVIDTLINNAGAGDTGRFDQEDPERILSMLQVNVVALTELTRLVLPQMVARKRGKVMLLASTASFQPGVCTENFVQVDLMAESPTVRVDDRAVLLVAGSVRFGIQVEKPTCGGKRGAPTSACRAAAEGARSHPVHELRSLVPNPAVSVVSVCLEGDHHHSAGDPRALAPHWFPSVLAMEIPLLGWSATNRCGPAGADSADERGQSVVGRAAHPWRTAQARI